MQTLGIKNWHHYRQSFKFFSNLILLYFQAQFLATQVVVRPGWPRFWPNSKFLPNSRILTMDVINNQGKGIP